MDRFNADGVVIKTSNTGETDRIITVLTRSKGLIRAFAKGARGTKSKLNSATSLFCYCSFGFYENKGVYTVTEAEVKQVFFDLRLDFDAMTLAQYFCEICAKTGVSEQGNAEYLRLLLNSFHYLCTYEKPLLHIKSVFELRYASISGYMPNVVACDGCAQYQSETMFFSCLSGKLYCSECGKALNLPSVPYSSVCAMRHILYSDFDKIFAFEISDDALTVLSRISEQYLENSFQQKFKVLDYFKL